MLRDLHTITVVLARLAILTFQTGAHRARADRLRDAEDLAC